MHAHAWEAFQGAINSSNIYLHSLLRRLIDYLSPEHTSPARLNGLIEATAALASLPNFQYPVLPVSIYQQAAVLACRGELLRLRKHQEDLEVRARDRQLLEGTHDRIKHLESILAIPGLAGALTTHKPRITDFVNVGVVEKESTGRATDEKFGILAAPNLFSDDYASAAEGAFSRGRSFAVAFIDIDDFKTFNNTHLETVVDRDMLPYFMRALEAYCYGRAYAYRQGGDEYLVLLRNATEREAKLFFEGLRAHIAEIEYPDTVTTKPTVSIGVHVIDGANEVTVFDAKKLANDGKNAAKKAGKNCVRLSSELPQMA